MYSSTPFLWPGARAQTASDKEGQDSSGLPALEPLEGSSLENMTLPTGPAGEAGSPSVLSQLFRPL